jgi:hypothetical protein
MTPMDFRKLTNKVISDEEVNDDDRNIVIGFVNYIKAYCADLKCTEHDIMIDDDLYNTVYGLYQVVVVNRKI